MKNRILTIILSVTTLAMLHLFLASCIFGDLYLIGNESVTTNELTPKEIGEIFLGRQKRWKDNKEIEFVIMDKTETHKLFIKKYLNKNPVQFRHWWRRQAFTGEGMMPRSFSSEKSLVEYISGKEGAVGYISSPIPEDAGIKEIHIVE